MHNYREKESAGKSSAESAGSSPAGTPEMEGIETEEESRAKKERLREEQRQRRKAVSYTGSCYLVRAEGN